MMGTVQRSMACDDVTAVSRSVSSKLCTTVSTATPMAAYAIQRAQVGRRSRPDLMARLPGWGP